MNVCWIKRDARVLDHAALHAACNAPLPVIVLYIYEPSQLLHPTFHGSHLSFLNQGLLCLHRQLQAIGGQLTCRTDEVEQVFESLQREAGLTIRGIYSHSEVGHGVTTERNKRVRAWAASKAVEWHQFNQMGVFDRRFEASEDEKTWAARWKREMSAEALVPPTAFHPVPDVVAGALQSAAQLAEQLELPPEHHLLCTRPEAQQGGEQRALELLTSFLSTRGAKYSVELSSPVTAWTSCSRLSVYLTFGHISLRLVFQRLTKEQTRWRADKSAEKSALGWPKSLAAFGGRLRYVD